MKQKKDVFKKEYKKLSEASVAQIIAIKNAAEVLYSLYPETKDVDARMIELAKQNLEQSVMWAVKGIAK